MRCENVDFIKGAYFHIYHHAVNKELLFRDRDDYLYFLEKLNKYLPSCPISIISYCLIPNHFHFLIKQKTEIPAFKLFNLTSVAFVRHINTKYHRIGTIFRGKLNHIKVDKEKYLVYLCQYIHCNPVRAGLVEKPEEWEFSNYRDWIGHRNGKLVDRQFINERITSIDDYVKNIESYLDLLDDDEFNKFL